MNNVVLWHFTNKSNGKLNSNEAVRFKADILMLISFVVILSLWSPPYKAVYFVSVCHLAAMLTLWLSSVAARFACFLFVCVVFTVWSCIRREA